MPRYGHTVWIKIFKLWTILIVFTNVKNKIMKKIIVTGGLGFIGSNLIELLIKKAEEQSKELGYTCMFSVGRSKHLIETHKKLGWHVDKRPSHELVKILN